MRGMPLKQSSAWLMELWSRVTVSSIGMAAISPARSSGETSSAKSEKESPKEARRKRVFSPPAAARLSAKATASSRKGGMELELSTSSIQVTGNPACRTVSRVLSAGKVRPSISASAFVMGWSVPEIST